MRCHVDGSVGGGPGTRHRLDGRPRVVRVEVCSHGVGERVRKGLATVHGLTIGPLQVLDLLLRALGTKLPGKTIVGCFVVAPLE